MSSYNHCEFIGRITHDIELRQTPTGTSVIRFRIAVDRSRRKDGDKVTDFITCSAFDKRAEAIARNFHKGSQIFVIGEMQYRQYETRSGDKRETYELSVSEFLFVDKFDPYDRDEPVVSVPGKPDPVKYDSPAYNGGKDTGTSGFVDIPADGELPF